MKIDLHVHTSDISFCGRLSAEQTISLYREAGYDAIVITDHFSAENADMWKTHGVDNFTEYYFEKQKNAIEFGKKQGLLVLPGCEFRFKGSCNDYLVYGLNEELVKNHPEVYDMTPDSFSEFAQENGILFYQAHPFRNGMKVINPALLFGIEVMNNHPRHDSRNDIALYWAEKFGLHKIGGSDCHQLEDVGTAGIETDYPVQTINDLIHVLKNDLYQIFHK